MSPGVVLALRPSIALLLLTTQNSRSGSGEIGVPKTNYATGSRCSEVFGVWHRAREVLTISFALTRRKWGKPRKTIPSRFLYEMTGQADNPRSPANDGPTPAGRGKARTAKTPNSKRRAARKSTPR